MNQLTSEWMAAHADEIGADGLRTIASLETTRDLFNPDLSSRLARCTWIRETKEKYVQLLEQRKAERAQSAEAEAAASRARAVAAMGLQTDEQLTVIAYNAREQHRGEALFTELQSLDLFADHDDYCDDQGYDISAIESEIERVKRSMQAPGS